MRIQHNIMAMNAQRNLGMNNSKLSKNLEKLSSGYRINRAGDDAAGLAISEKMRSQIAGLDQAQKNAQSGINMIQTAEGALTEVHDMLNRMVTLSTQAANGTYTSTDAQKIQDEVNALVDEIDRIATNSNFNGMKLLDGSISTSGSSIALQIGSSSAETLSVGVSSMNSAGLAINSLVVTTVASANAAIDTINSAIEAVSVQRSKLGALQNRLEHTINNLGVMEENIQDAESNIRDTDIADEMMAYTKNNILIQSAQAMLAQANQVPQGVLQLMQ